MLRGAIFDLDGTVYRGVEAVDGAADYVAALRARGVRCLFVTNRANRGADEVAAHLRDVGIACGADEVLTTAHAAARLLRGRRVHVVGEEPLRRELRAAGIALADEGADAVLVSLDRSFGYATLARAVRLIGQGAAFIATNPDRVLPTPEGPLPGTGAIVAAVATAAGVQPDVIGKPEPLLMRLALERLGVEAGEAVAVGDNLETDVPAAVRAGLRIALLLTGVTRAGDVDRAAVRPTWVVRNYAELRAITDAL